MGNSLTSLAAILSAPDSLCTPLRDWLELLGWRCMCAASVDGLNLGEDDRLALLLLDGGIDPAIREHAVTTLRAVPGLAAGTPVLLIATPDAAGQGGVADRIDLPLEQARAMAVMERWAGPLAEHDLRDLSSPHYRLIRLAGRDGAERLLRGFVQHVEAALTGLDGDEPVTTMAHQVAGLAGTLGYGELSALWSAVERGEAPDTGPARTATLAVLDALRRILPKE